MSNALAVAAVTAVVRFVLDRALRGSQPGPVGGAEVTTLHPADIPARNAGGETYKGINVFLYRVTPNHAGNLTDLPARRADGSLARRPTAALDLHYLFTFHGDDTDYDAQRLLGRAVLALAVTPVLTRDVVSLAMADEDGPDFFAHVDLAAQTELVKFAPSVVAIEELGQLWSAFGTGYRLCLTYTATVVVLEADLTARVALPVRRPVVTAGPVSRPRIAAVEPAGVSVGDRLGISGSGLTGRGLAVRIGPAELAPDATGLRADLVPVVVTGAVPAGVHALQVVHRSPDRVLARSNAVPVLVRPAVTGGDVTGQAVTFRVEPGVFPGQRAVLTLTGEDAQLTFAVEAPAAGEPPAGEVVVARADIPDGTWRMRLTVDGADSLPELVGETYSGPVLVLS